MLVRQWSKTCDELTVGTRLCSEDCSGAQSLDAEWRPLVVAAVTPDPGVSEALGVYVTPAPTSTTCQSRDIVAFNVAYQTARSDQTSQNSARNLQCCHLHGQYNLSGNIVRWASSAL